MKYSLIPLLLIAIEFSSCGGGASKSSNPKAEAAMNDSMSQVAAAMMDSLTNVSNNDEPTYKQVPVFYGTDRIKTNGVYGNERGGGNVSLGVVCVTIPVNHKVGAVETPGVWGNLMIKMLGEKYAKANYLNIDTVKELPLTSFYSELRKLTEGASKNDAFLFVHGYNNSFNDAALRTAQIAYDIGYKGAPIMYSWPSKSKVQGYFADEENVVWAKQHFINFLKNILDSSKANKIHVIAHSMGNRLVAEALKELSNDNVRRSKIHQIILAAPDIDAETFKTDIAPQLVQAYSNITIYSSENDLALAESKRVHGTHIRLGETGQNICVIPGIVTIDASNINVSDFFDHAYFAEAWPILSDIRELIIEEKLVDARNLQKLLDGHGKAYWAFKR